MTAEIRPSAASAGKTGVAAKEPRLCILTKPWVLGLNKTRLARHIGRESAHALAAAFLQDSYAAALELEYTRVAIALSEPGPLPELLPPPEVWRQSNGDLGQRMVHVARHALALASPWVILIGSDSPGLPSRLLNQAARVLEAGVEAVVGPADDGGFYLLGLRRCPAGLLDGLAWSQPDTLIQTLDRLQQHGLTVELIDGWFDVDQPADLTRLARELAEGKLLAPATERALGLTAGRPR
jgi:rSAM/selenodomain-associated transferase 1